MIDHSKVAFDVDGVVADTISLFLDIARKDYGIASIPYNQPWNRAQHPFPNADDWPELAKILGIS